MNTIDQLMFALSLDQIRSTLLKENLSANDRAMIHGNMFKIKVAEWLNQGMSNNEIIAKVKRLLD